LLLLAAVVVEAQLQEEAVQAVCLPQQYLCLLVQITQLLLALAVLALL
jgi:hypothetical protein